MGNKFCIGEKVMLNSGGPVMTIIGLTGNKCICAWITDGAISTVEFHEECITSV